ncbi:hypothetical protein [Parasulfitobacter algicola]|uniref:GHMP kinase N-terminal domain-containing protein n=1 Tax=Parasulfitobacter algicola TaxID=2614809 RepID=A0ABX2IV73_9RHOB|nr:hypothetical protein [Sulfitobacter algicola]NSX56821.1 hypothetical protein [Sulfitobacter algicola]
MCLHVGLSCGTLGEFYQGPSFGNDVSEIAIISPLIPKYSRITFVPKTSSCSPFIASQEVTRETKPKMFAGIDHYCALHGLEAPDGIWLNVSDLPTGHGFASSTADIVAGIRCVARVQKREPNTSDFLKILSKIERSDSVFINETTFFSSSHHRVLGSFGARLGLTAVFTFDGEEVSTENTKEQLIAYYQDNENDYRRLAHDLRECLQNRDVRLLCECSTRSAELSQQVMPKKHYAHVQEAAEIFGADGIVVAHTGTILGLLFGERPDSVKAQSISGYFKCFGARADFVEIL